MTPFSREALEDLFDRLDIPIQTRAMIDRALEVPSRRVQSTPYNVKSIPPCPKMGVTAQAESRTGERKAIYHYIFSDDVIGYLDQPFEMELQYRSKNGRTVRTSYTVDFIVFYKNAIFLEEWKPEESLAKLTEKYPGRYVLEQDNTYRSYSAEDAAAALGIRFRIRCNEELTDLAYRSQIYLRSYLYDRTSIGNTSRASIRDYFEKYSYASIAELRRALPNITIDEIQFAIANGLVACDFNSVYVEEQSRFILYRNTDILNAAKEIVGGTQIAPVARAWSKNLFTPGVEVIFSGKPHTVIVAGDLELWLQPEKGDPFPLRLPVVEREFKQGRLQVLSEDQSSDPLFLENPLRFAGPKEIKHAITMRDKLRVWQRGGEQPKGDYSDRTYRGLQQKERLALASGLDPIVAFLPKWSRRGNRGPKVAPRVDQIVEDVLDAHYYTLIGPTKWKTYGTLCKSLEKEGQKPISKPAFLKRIKARHSSESIAKRRGRKAGYQKEKFAWYLDQKSPRHGDYPMQIVHIDHTQLQIEVISSIDGRSLGRPWLTLAICAFTRRIVGFYLSLKSPSYISCMAVLFDIVRRYGRVPDTIVVDGGAEFSSIDYEQLCAFLEIESMSRPKSAARAGNVIERVLGFTQSAFIDNLIGNTKMRRNVRELTPEINPSNLAVYTLALLFEGLEEWFYDIYDTRPSTLLVSPRASYEAGLMRTGMRLQRLRSVEDLVPIAFPSVRGQTRSLDPQRGVDVNYRNYRNPRIELLHLAKMDVHVKAHITNPGIVYVLLNREWIPCYSDQYTALEAMSEGERQCVFEEWLVLQRLREQDLFAVNQRTSEMIDRRNAEATMAAEMRNVATGDRQDLPGAENSSASPRPGDSTFDTFTALIEKVKQKGSDAKLLQF